MNAITLAAALGGRRSHRNFTEEPVALEVLQRLIWAAQGTSDDDDKRTAPSAHALHPLRLYVSAGRVSGIEAGAYISDPMSEDLNLHVDQDVRAKLEREALEDQPWIGAAAGIITICADLVTPSQAFADQPPYGVRGLRYVHIEAGAAAQNMGLQAAAEGLGCVLVAGFKDEATAGVLNLEPPLGPILHMCFGWPSES
ncbi:MAG: SagB/ThcOx family dehydrogenase [Alphaproteobacteria bacterium]|nr:SagB/ThcOx family dehydrogenase [Alphaproteobacteria bacterium]